MPSSDVPDIVPGRVLLEADAQLRTELRDLTGEVRQLVGQLGVYLPKIDQIQKKLDEMEVQYGARLVALETQMAEDRRAQERELANTRIWIGAIATVLAGVVIALIVKAAGLK